MREINYKPPSSSSVFRLGTWVLGGLVAVYLVFASWYIVDQGERAVVLRLGAHRRRSGARAALQDSVDRHGPQDHRAESEPALSARSRPTRATSSRRISTVSVTFVASDPSAVYEQYGDLEGAIARLIDPRVMSGVKTIFGQYDAVARDSRARRPQHRHQQRDHVGDHGPDQHHQRAGREHRLLRSLRAERRAAHARAGRDPAPRAEPAHDGSRSADRTHARRRRGRTRSACAARPKARRSARAPMRCAQTPISCSCRPWRSGTASCRRRWCRARRCRSSICSRRRRAAE